MNRISILIASLVAGCTFVTNVSAQATDILGVAIGMNAKEASDALQKANPKFRLETNYYAGPDGKPTTIANIRACASSETNNTRCYSSSPTASFDAATVTFGSANGKAFHVSRKWTPGPTAPLATTFIEAAKQKYVKLDNEGGTAGSGRYGFAANTDGKNDKNLCQPLAFDPVVAPNQAHPNCGLRINVFVFWDEGSNVLREASVGVFDHRVLLADIKQGNASAAAKKQAEDAAKAEAARKSPVKM